MASSADNPRRRPTGPPPQDNLERAVERAFAAVCSQPQEQLLWLGAEHSQDVWRLPVLNETFAVDPSAGRITTSVGREVGPHWGILALHYLAVRSRPGEQAPRITFADLGTARSYAGVYHQRVIARLCATAGRDAETLRAAARGLGGRSAQVGARDQGSEARGRSAASLPRSPAPDLSSLGPDGWAGDLAFDFDVFPRVSTRLLWYAADEEFPPSATLLLPDNIESYFCSEDVVVLSERLVSRLGGRPF